MGSFPHFKGYRASPSMRNVGSQIKYAREEGLLARDLLSLVFALFMQTTKSTPELTFVTLRFPWRRHAEELWDRD